MGALGLFVGRGSLRGGPRRPDSKAECRKDQEQAWCCLLPAVSWDRASPSQQWCAMTHPGRLTDPWGPAFLLGISHIGVEHLQTDLNYSISSPFQ